jgi:serine/threonine protein kinase
LISNFPPEFLGTGTFGRVVIVSTDKSEKSSHYAIKILSIIDVIKKKQTEHVKSEKNILLEISHPFVINM